MTSYEDHHLEQILSLLNDQRECVTLRSIMLELTVTRCVARDILEELVNRSASSKVGDTGMKYEVMRMIPKKVEEGKRTLMELVATDPSVSDDENNNKGSIFSISICNDTQDAVEINEDDVDENGNDISNPNSSHSGTAAILLVSAAHEKALAVQRDMFTSGSNGGASQLCSIFGADGIGTSSGSRYVLPAPELCVENEDGISIIRREKRGRDVVVVGASYPSSAAGKKSKFGTTSSLATSKSSHASTKKGKATTAAAFFKNASATSSKAKKPAAKKKEEEKENSRNKKVTTSVDDFVGDIDEDEEFLEEERARKERVARKATKEARERENDDKVKKRNTEGAGRRAKDASKRQKHHEKSEDNAMDIEYDDAHIDDDEKKTGALDAFTKKREKSSPSTTARSSSGGVKKRRKKLVEETTVDANGYMRTETITVWEDVSDDEVEVKSSKPAVAKAVATKPKAKSVKKSGGSKKQAGLASFFAKKK